MPCTELMLQIQVSTIIRSCDFFSSFQVLQLVRLSILTKQYKNLGSQIVMLISIPSWEWDDNQFIVKRSR